MNEIIASYDVTFVIDRGGDTRTQAEQTDRCLLTSGYSTFDDLRQMIAKQHSVAVDQVDVLSAVKVREVSAVNGSVGVTVWGDVIRAGFTTDRSDLVVIDVDGRSVVGLSLNTGAVGVWPGGTDETRTEVDVCPAPARKADSSGPDHPVGWGQPDGMLSSCPPPVAYGIVDWRGAADPTLIVAETIEQARREGLRMIRREWSDCYGYFAKGGEGFPAPDADTATDEQIRECLQQMHHADAEGLPLFTHAGPGDINQNVGQA